MTSPDFRLDRSSGYRELSEHLGDFVGHTDQGRRTAYYSGYRRGREFILSQEGSAALPTLKQMETVLVAARHESSRLYHLAEGWTGQVEQDTEARDDAIALAERLGLDRVAVRALIGAEVPA